MSGTGKVRSERWRERRRKGLIAIMVDVSPAHRRVFERMGLVQPGHDQDPAALTWAVERYLDTAPAVQGIGEALYPDPTNLPIKPKAKAIRKTNTGTPLPENSGGM